MLTNQDVIDNAAEHVLGVSRGLDQLWRYIDVLQASIQQLELRLAVLEQAAEPTDDGR